ncbi:MAG: GNAT family N-acetyltransferase, partial [Eubacterium sp.]
YDKVMTSSQANETAQHFYRKLGYRDAGGFFPFCKDFEILFTKEI